MLRYPDGKREQITLPEQAKLLVSISNWKCLLKRAKLINWCNWLDSLKSVLGIHSLTGKLTEVNLNFN